MSQSDINRMFTKISWNVRNDQVWKAGAQNDVVELCELLGLLAAGPGLGLTTSEPTHPRLPTPSVKRIW